MFDLSTVQEKIKEIGTMTSSGLSDHLNNTEGFYARIEDSFLLGISFGNMSVTATYSITFADDGSFPDDTVETRKGRVFVSFDNDGIFGGGLECIHS